MVVIQVEVKHAKGAVEYVASLGIMHAPVKTR